jgi:AcrR family transcriptional regulator
MTNVRFAQEGTGLPYGDEERAARWAHARPPVMRSRKGAATSERIVLAAAHLFAERGIDAVEAAEVLAAAGQHNASAITYYFGSLHGLVTATLVPRDDVRVPIGETRAALYEHLTAGGGQPSLHDLVRALAAPMVASLSDGPSRDFLRIAAQVVRTLRSDDRASPYIPSERRVITAIAEGLAILPDEIRAERLGTAYTLLIELVANRAGEIEHGRTPNLDDEAFVDELVNMLVGLLTAPSTT